MQCFVPCLSQFSTIMFFPKTRNLTAHCLSPPRCTGQGYHYVLKYGWLEIVGSSESLGMFTVHAWIHEN